MKRGRIEGTRRKRVGKTLWNLSDCERDGKGVFSHFINFADLEIIRNMRATFYFQQLIFAF